MLYIYNCPLHATSGGQNKNKIMKNKSKYTILSVLNWKKNVVIAITNNKCYFTENVFLLTYL